MKKRQIINNLVHKSLETTDQGPTFRDLTHLNGFELPGEQGDIRLIAALGDLLDKHLAG